MPAPLGFRIWEHASQGMPVSHVHLDVELNYLTSGSVEYFLGGRFYRLRRDCLTLFWAGIPHATRPQTELSRGLWATLPIDWLLASRHLQELCRRLLEGHILRAPMEASKADGARLREWLADFTSGRQHRLAAMQLELEARLVRFQSEQEIAPNRTPAPGTKVQFERITALISEQYTDPALRTDRLAAELRLHPKYLLRLFRRSAGMTMWEYVTRLRLAQAKRLALTSEITILQAALQAGFGSSSAYYEAAKRYEPVTPRAAR